MSMQGSAMMYVTRSSLAACQTRLAQDRNPLKGGFRSREKSLKVAAPRPHRSYWRRSIASEPVSSWTRSGARSTSADFTMTWSKPAV
jgi:hypothetical protein